MRLSEQQRSTGIQLTWRPPWTAPVLSLYEVERALIALPPIPTESSLTGKAEEELRRLDTGR